MASSSLLYLDACAATPPAEAVMQAMAEHQPWAWANPSSLHPAGLAAAESLERSRQELAALLGWGSAQVVFTSGGTEANNLALFGVCRALGPGRLVLSAIEHPAVSAAAIQLGREGWQIQTIPVDNQGLVDLAALGQLLQPPTRLVSIGWANSEVGTVQPMQAIAELCRGAGVLLHSDAVQAVGQIPLNLEQTQPDLLSLSAHKFQGPRGIGALLFNPGLELVPPSAGGGQEGGLRAGTESVVLAAGLVAALALRHRQQPALAASMASLRDHLGKGLSQIAGLQFTGAVHQRLPHHLSLLLQAPGGRPLAGRAAVRALGRRGVAVGSGSACSSGLGAPSPTLLALGYGPDQARAGLRLSLGPWISEKDLEPLPGLLESVLIELAAEAP
ncbi:MAG: Cysteine desulfurase [Cyanobacteriota bacterium]